MNKAKIELWEKHLLPMRATQQAIVTEIGYQDEDGYYLLIRCNEKGFKKLNTFLKNLNKI